MRFRGFQEPFKGVPTGFVVVVIEVRGFQRCFNSIKRILKTFQVTSGAIQVFSSHDAGGGSQEPFKGVTSIFRGVLRHFKELQGVSGKF